MRENINKITENNWKLKNGNKGNAGGALAYQGKWGNAN